MKGSFGKILIGVVVFGLCLGAAFGAGTAYGRNSTTNAASAASQPTHNGFAANSSTTATSTAPASAAEATTASGRGSRGGFAFGGGLANRPLQGAVSSISPQQLNLSVGTNGTALTLALDAQTTYAQAQTADRSALKTGDNVDVTTATSSDGTISAAAVIVVPAPPATQADATPVASGGSSSTGTGGFGSSGSFGGARAGGGGRSIDGTIASISETQVSVKQANGSSTTLTLSPQTTYQTTQSATQSAITSGASVLVMLNRGSDGTAMALSVIVLPKAG